MKILLVEDNQDLLYIYQETIEDELPGFEVITAENGTKAIELISKQQFDLVISDYTMPGHNGGEVFLHLKNNQKHTPFLLVTGEDLSLLNEFKDIDPDDNVRLLNKPVNVEVLIEYIYQIQQGKVDTETSIDYHQAEALPPENDKDFNPVSINHLLKLNESPCDLFIKLSANKMIKVLAKSDTNFVDQLMSYQRKGVDFLFIPKDQMELFDQINREVHLRGAKDKEISFGSRTSFIQKSFKSIQDHLINFGFDQKAIQQAQELTNATLEHFSQQKPVQALLQYLDKDGQGYFLDHAALCTTLTITILKFTDWDNESSREKLVMASLFHDISLLSPKYEEMERDHFLGGKEVRPKLSGTERSVFRGHPQKSAELVSKLNSLSDVYNIIIEHHERPDGKGFPRGIHANRIGALSSILIVAHHISDILLEKIKSGSLSEESSKDIANEIKELRKLYNEGHFKELINDKLLAVINPS